MHILDLVELRVVKEGLGSWGEVQGMPVDVVMDAFHYSVFLASYSQTEYELNQPAK